MHPRYGAVVLRYFAVRFLIGSVLGLVLAGLSVLGVGIPA